MIGPWALRENNALQFSDNYPISACVISPPNTSHIINWPCCSSTTALYKASPTWHLVIDFSFLCDSQRLTVHFSLTGTLVVNLGDCLQAWTKGLYRATRHRVRRSIKTDRYSVPLFFNPNRGCIIEPIETDVTRNLTFTKIVKGLEMPFRYGDFARTLLEKSHGWSRRQNKID